MGVKYDITRLQRYASHPVICNNVHMGRALGGLSLISMLALYMIQHSFLIHLGVPNTMKNLVTGYAQCDRVV